MKDKQIYFVDDYGGILVVPVSFQLLWEASREAFDVPKKDRILGLIHFSVENMTQEFVVGSVVHSLCEFDEQPKESELFFSSPLKEQICN